MKHTLHSQEKMNTRGITRDEIEFVLLFCDPDYRERFICNRKVCEMIEFEIDKAIRERDELVQSGKKHH